MTATTCVHPMDNIKVRIQTLNEKSGQLGLNKKSPTWLNTARYMLKNEGFKSFYKGVDAGLLRQCIYASVRLGVYKAIYERRLQQIKEEGRGEITFTERLGLSLVSGFVGSIIGNPLDLSLVRLQNEVYLKPEQRRNYKNVLDVLLRIPNEEGLLVYWRGFATFSLRVMALTSSQLTTFDQFKISINKLRGREESDFLTRVISVSMTGFVASACALPFDNVKMKLMKMSKDKLGNYPYKGVLDCALKSI